MLNVVSPDEARALVLEKFRFERPVRDIPVTEINEDVLAADIVSDCFVPSFDRSTVDGWALIASSVFGASESVPAMLKINGEIAMGSETDLAVSAESCCAVSTGGMLPSGADAVVMREYTEKTEDGFCLVYKPVSPGENVTRRGDDVKNGETVLKKGTSLTPASAGVLAAMGIDPVPVYGKIKVGIISTGDELVSVGETPLPGQVRDVNTSLLCSLCLKYGCKPVCYGIVPDCAEKLAAAVAASVGECDITLVSGGSSAGERDLTAEIISRSGSVFVHGLAMKPGKPTIIGGIDEKPVFGLPGHPAAAFFVFNTVVLPLIEKFAGREFLRRTVKARLKYNISSNNGREEYTCVRLENGEAYPLLSKSGIISMLSRADGYIRTERNLEGVKAGTEVTVTLFR